MSVVKRILEPALEGRHIPPEMEEAANLLRAEYAEVFRSLVAPTRALVRGSLSANLVRALLHEALDRALDGRVSDELWGDRAARH